jgi:uncharacterized protein YggE
VGPLVEGAVQEGIVDFRSLSYSLQDEEGAKQKAVAAAMKNAVGRATAALTQTGQKVGAIRYASVDVRQLEGVAQFSDGFVTNDLPESPGADKRKRFTSPLPTVAPAKVTVSATVQCAFQIQ